MEADEHLFVACRSVERNPLRAGLVTRAERWRWSSLWRQHGDTDPRPFLAEWPAPRPEDWAARVNAAQTDSELAALRRSVQRGCPFGSSMWQTQVAARLGLGPDQLAERCAAQAHPLRPLAGHPRSVEHASGERHLLSALVP